MDVASKHSLAKENWLASKEHVLPVCAVPTLSSSISSCIEMEAGKGESIFLSQPLCKSVSRADAEWMCMCCNVPCSFAWTGFETVKGEGLVCKLGTSPA